MEFISRGFPARGRRLPLTLRGQGARVSADSPLLQETFMDFTKLQENVARLEKSTAA